MSANALLFKGKDDLEIVISKNKDGDIEIQSRQWFNVTTITLPKEDALKLSRFIEETFSEK